MTSLSRCGGRKVSHTIVVCSKGTGTFQRGKDLQCCVGHSAAVTPVSSAAGPRRIWPRLSGWGSGVFVPANADGETALHAPVRRQRNAQQARQALSTSVPMAPPPEPSPPPLRAPPLPPNPPPPNHRRRIHRHPAAASRLE
jgi:hypothetical protein